MTTSELYFLDLFLTADPAHAEDALLSVAGCDSMESPETSHPSTSDGKAGRIVRRAIHFLRHDLRKSIQALRSEAPLADTGRDEAADDSKSLLEQAGQMTPDRLQRALFSLDPLQRCVIVLRLFAQWSLPDVAVLLDVNVAFLRAALGQALRHLTERVYDEAESSVASRSSVQVIQEIPLAV
jgi:hypothetical protein